jgi:hypothetical protein
MIAGGELKQARDALLTAARLADTFRNKNTF